MSGVTFNEGTSKSSGLIALQHVYAVDANGDPAVLLYAPGDPVKPEHVTGLQDKGIQVGPNTLAGPALSDALAKAKADLAATSVKEAEIEGEPVTEEPETPEGEEGPPAGDTPAEEPSSEPVALAISPTSLSFSGAEDAEFAPQTVSVTVGDGVTVLIHPSEDGYFAVSNPSLDGPGAINVVPTVTAPGTYTGTIVFTTEAESATLSASATVSAAEPAEPAAETEPEAPAEEEQPAPADAAAADKGAKGKGK